MAPPSSSEARPPEHGETLFDEMKRYVRFTVEDARVLASFGVVAAPHFPRIAAEFYERVREHEEAHRVFTGEAQINRLRATMVRWMERLCAGPHDEAYFEERARIGRMHVRIGLPQRYMFTAMALIRASLGEIADELTPPELGARARGALARILDLELAIMLETYRDDFVARLQRVERLERARLERALARSEHRYVNAVELARVMIVGLDAAGRVSLFNREAERVSGYARDEVLGEPFARALLPEAVREEEGARLARVAAGEHAALDAMAAWDVPLRTRAGRQRDVRWQLAYAPHSADDDVVLFAIGQDMTEANALLERTMRSEKLAAVGTLAAGLAHEIRNPLNGALLHVTFLERALKRGGGSDKPGSGTGKPAGSAPPPEPETLAAVRFVGDELRRLSELVKDFLVFARPAPPQLAPTVLADVCVRALDAARGDAEAGRVKLETDLATNVPVLRLDASKIESAVLNLLRNAVEAVASQGGGAVTVRTRRAPRHVHVEVEDNGPGLPSPDAPIFDAFYSTKSNGTGLGLAIVHRIVSDHGGTVEVESQPGQTVFRVVLPITNGDIGEK